MKSANPVYYLIAAAALFVAAGCAGPPAYSYVVDYQVVGDKTIKYIYVPGEESQARGAYLNQSIALEICTLDDEASLQASVSPQESPQETEAEGDEQEVVATTEVEAKPVEYDCRQSRILRTQEYR